MTTPHPPQGQAEFPDFEHRFAGPLIVLAAFTAASILTWRRCGDLLQDFGHQLYVPWQLSEGATLYQDIFWLYGPLSQSFNALLFSSFGASLGTLLTANLVIMAVLCIVIYVLVEKASDRLSATLSTIFVMGVFCFGHYLEEGNFNFAFPYAHEATHGITLLACAIFFWSRAAGNGSSLLLFFGSLAAGLALLTKAEIAITSLVMAAMLPVLHSGTLGRRMLAPFLLGLLAPGLVCLAVYSSFLFLPDALRATGGALGPLLSHPELMGTSFHLQNGGWNDPKTYLESMALMSLVLACVLLLIILADFLNRSHRQRKLVASLLAIAAFALLFLQQDKIPWLDVPRGLPVLAAIILIFLKGHLPREPERRLIICLWALASALLISRLGIRVRFYHYGFFLALPLAAGLIPLLTYALPLRLKRLYQGGFTARWAACSLCAVFLAVHVHYSAFYYSMRSTPIGEQGDRFYALADDLSSRTRLSRQLLEHAADAARSGQSLLIMPSGTAIHYLLRTKSPTPYPWIGIDVLIAAGEETVRNAIASAAPALVALVGDAEDGFSFGLPEDDPEQGRMIKDYIAAHYSSQIVLETASEPTIIEIQRRTAR